jgi:Sulfotransferase domain
MAIGRIPNFIYIGTNKAGSTWLYDILANHPDVYMAPSKGLYFFSNHYERGLDWYRSHFVGAGDQKIVGEISHSYMYSKDACKRIAETNPTISLMVCLREPVDHAFTDYLNGVKNGFIQGDFETELERNPPFLQRSHYTRYLAPYIEQFGRDSIHVGVFDELSADPNAYAKKIFAFLGIEELELSHAQRQKMMPAAKPRSPVVARFAKKASHTARALGLRGLQSRVKRSRTVRNILYRPYEPYDKPTMHPETRTWLRAHFDEETAQLDELLGTNLRQTWGYD